MNGRNLIDCAIETWALFIVPTSIATRTRRESLPLSPLSSPPPRLLDLVETQCKNMVSWANIKPSVCIHETFRFNYEQMINPKQCWKVRKFNQLNRNLQKQQHHHSIGVYIQIQLATSNVDYMRFWSFEMDDVIIETLIFRYNCIWIRLLYGSSHNMTFQKKETFF
jgi:hypothetical protein